MLSQLHDKVVAMESLSDKQKSIIAERMGVSYHLRVLHPLCALYLFACVSNRATGIFFCLRYMFNWRTCFCICGTGSLQILVEYPMSQCSDVKDLHCELSYSQIEIRVSPPWPLSAQTRAVVNVSDENREVLSPNCVWLQCDVSEEQKSGTALLFKVLLFI